MAGCGESVNGHFPDLRSGHGDTAALRSAYSVTTCLFPKLALVQFAVQSFLLQQLFMRSPLHLLAPVEHKDMIGMADGAEPVRNHNSGSAL